MSTLSGMISYAFRSRSKAETRKQKEKYLPREQWEAKLRKEGKWVDRKK